MRARQMAFGASPFAHLSMAQKIGAVMSSAPVRIPPHPDAELRDTLARCLQRDAKASLSPWPCVRRG